MVATGCRAYGTRGFAQGESAMSAFCQDGKTPTTYARLVEGGRFAYLLPEYKKPSSEGAR